MPNHFRCLTKNCEERFTLPGGSSRDTRCPKCNGATRPDYNPPVDKSIFYKQIVEANRQVRVEAIRGRCGSAPLSTESENLTKGNNPNVTYVSDLTDIAWTSSTHKIRLAYRNLVTDAKTPVQGIIINNPHLALVGKLVSHFQKITTVMSNPQCDGKSATEATGEAAAAMGMMQSVKYAGYKMLSGFGNHSGPGVDQIWGKPRFNVKGSYEGYVIVEAKGVGQILGNNVHSFEDYGIQMSEGWVLDRLGRMCNSNDPISSKVAKKLLEDVGLILDRTAVLGGGNKKFWKVQTGHLRTPGKAGLDGIVFTATWNGTDLGYITSGEEVYFAAT